MNNPFLRLVIATLAALSHGALFANLGAAEELARGYNHDPGLGVPSPGSAECRRLRTCLRDVLSDTDRTRTFPATFPLVRLDHVLISPDLESAAAAVLRSPLMTMASDHCPVLADLRVRG